MTKFERTEPSADESPKYVLEKYSAGPVTVIIRAFAFGQQRIQVWVDRGGFYPDILGPEC